MMWMQVRISAQLDAGVQHQPAGEVEIDTGMKLDQEKAARRVRIARSDQRAHFVRRMDPRGVPHAQIAEKHSPVDRNQQTVFRNILQHGNAAALQLCNYVGRDGTAKLQEQVPAQEGSRTVDFGHWPAGAGIDPPGFQLQKVTEINSRSEEHTSEL